MNHRHDKELLVKKNINDIQTHVEKQTEHVNHEKIQHALVHFIVSVNVPIILICVVILGKLLLQPSNNGIDEVVNIIKKSDSLVTNKP